MRVTLGEIFQGQMLVIMGALEIGEGKAHVRDYPVPVWTAYVLVAAGLVIPLLAWYVRRPLQQTESQND